MGLVDDDNVVAQEERVSKQLCDKHAIGDVLNASVGGAGFIETNGIADEGADRGGLFQSDTGSE